MTRPRYGREARESRSPNTGRHAARVLEPADASPGRRPGRRRSFRRRRSTPHSRTHTLGIAACGPPVPIAGMDGATEIAFSPRLLCLGKDGCWNLMASGGVDRWISFELGRLNAVIDW